METLVTMSSKEANAMTSEEMWLLSMYLNSALVELAALWRTKHVLWPSFMLICLCSNCETCINPTHSFDAFSRLDGTTQLCPYRAVVVDLDHARMAFRDL